MTLPINHSRRALVPGLAVLALVALAGAATAQVTAQQQSAIRSSCRSDFTSKCSGVTPGGKDALACLQKNVASLSGGCKTAVSATMPAPAPAQAAPAPAATAAPQPAPAAPAQAPAAKSADAPPAAAPKVRQAAPKPAQLHKPAAPIRAAVVPPAPVAPPAAAPAPPAAPAPTAGGIVPGGILISKACARYALMHCPGMGLDMARKVACLVNYANSGNFMGPRCKAALKIAGHLR